MPGVRIVEAPGFHGAVHGGIAHLIGQPPPQHVVAGVAAVAVHIGPRVAEELPFVVAQGQRLHHRQAG